MKNETDRQITRHSLPTRMSFNFFYPPHKNFEILPTHIAHIGKSHQPTRRPKLAKECNLANTQGSTIFTILIKPKALCY
ncbi:MAG: hypothetical protein KBG17_09705 [Paludibacteraceae bacterium]|nr:hypothetical protein [Paludibacteraceae bacterium]